MYLDSRRGFTLIELLVVIAIIGILSAVVLAALNTARSKGSDAGIKANLNVLGSQGLIFLSDNSNSFGVFNNGSGAPAACPLVGVVGATIFHNPTVERAIAAALADSYSGIAVCYSTGNAYAVAVSRPPDVAADTSTYWCVDSAGVHCGVNSNVLGSGSGGGPPACGVCASTQ